MTLTTYEPTMTMMEARKRYFDTNHFGDDGGYGDAWVDFQLGPIPFPFPNTKGRIRAVKVHDLHHIVTAYDTNLIGELEIGAWEVGAGCKDFYAAWFLNLSSMGGGFLFAPVRTYRAFLRGRHSSSLYGRDLDELLQKTVADIRRETRVDEARLATPTAADRALHVAGTLVGLVVTALFMTATLPLAPIGLALAWLRKRAAGVGASGVGKPSGKSPTPA